MQLIRQLQFVVIMVLSRRRRSSVGGFGGRRAGGGVARLTSASQWGRSRLGGGMTMSRILDEVRAFCGGR